MSVQDLALQRSKYKHLSDEEWRWFLQQAEGRERTADKLPTFAAIEDWWYPVRLSCEQCSSELAAKYKAKIVASQTPPDPLSKGEENVASSMVDLTGGYGVDTYFLSESFAHTDYVEQNAELCRIATHNFFHKPISIHNTTAEDFLTKSQIVNCKSSNRKSEYDLIYIDPARRDSHGGKVFRLEDCTPNMVELLPTLLNHLTPNGRLMLKLSPMLDLTQAVKSLSQVTWDIHVVAIKNEVKEVLLLSGGASKITAIDLDHPDQAFVFTREEEQDCRLVNGTCENGKWLYEPNAAILKAGAYKTIATRLSLHKAAPNTHLYLSDSLVESFPGRVWRIVKTIKDRKDLPEGIKQANVITRNYPLKAEQLKKHLRLNDGGAEYIIGFRMMDKPTVVLAERIQ